MDRLRHWIFGSNNNQTDENRPVEEQETQPGQNNMIEEHTDPIPALQHENMNRQMQEQEQTPNQQLNMLREDAPPAPIHQPANIDGDMELENHPINNRPEDNYSFEEERNPDDNQNVPVYQQPEPNNIQIEPIANIEERDPVRLPLAEAHPQAFQQTFANIAQNHDAMQLVMSYMRKSGVNQLSADDWYCIGNYILRYRNVVTARSHPRIYALINLFRELGDVYQQYGYVANVNHPNAVPHSDRPPDIPEDISK